MPLLEQASTTPPGPPANGWVRAEAESGAWTIRLGGRWILADVERLAAALAASIPTAPAQIRIDFSAVEALDTAGAWIVFRFIRRLENEGHRVEAVGYTPAQSALIHRMASVVEERGPLARPFVAPVRAMVERLGRAVFDVGTRAWNIVSFIGIVTVVLARLVTRPRRLRLVSLIRHIEQIGLDAMPIVGLLSFMIGVVLAFQGSDQLRPYGAEIFTVNLLGVSILRELGVLMTAIMVAGRSGSAFTAEIGTMQINEEVDALRTLGLDPIEVLVLPRLLAMMISLPLLVFFSDMTALVGGAIMSLIALGISLPQFLTQLHTAILPSTFWVGIIKAPFFAFLIAVIGCYEGLNVKGSAESIGRLTTKSVVESIFIVIVADAAFSVFFSYIGV
jgi:phospholipid/cholesterol/gamma-HCH transport system permease protein